MNALGNIQIFPLDHPRSVRTLAALGLLCFALFAGYAAVQDSMKYPAAVALVCFMVLFRKWQEPYVLAGAFALFACAGTTVGFLLDKGMTYRWHGLFLLVGIGGLRTAYEKRWHVELRPLQIGMLVWIGYVVWSTVWAWDISYSFPRAVAIGIVAVAVFFSLWRYMAGWEEWTLTLKCLIAALVPFMMIQFVGSSSSSEVVMSGRFYGIMNHVNALGMLTMLSVPLGMYFLLDGPVRPAWRLLGGALMCLGISLLILSATRAAMVGVLLAALAYLMVRNPFRVILALSGLGILIAILIGYEVDIIDVFGLETLIRPETLPSGTNRLTAWWIGWLQHLESPIWGHGFASGTFLLVETSFRTITAQLSLGRYHNSYIELLVETGWVGTAPFLGFLVYMAGRGLGAFRKARGDLRYRRAVLGTGCVVLAGLAHATFETWLFSPGGPVTLLFWSLVACWMKLVLDPEPFRRPAAGA